MIQKQKTKTTLKRFSLLGVAPEQVERTRQKFFNELQAYAAELGDMYSRTTRAPANGHDVVKLAVESLQNSDIYLAVVNGKALAMFHFLLDPMTKNVTVQIFQGVISTAYLEQFMSAAVEQAFEKTDANKLKAEPTAGSVDAQVFEACEFEAVGVLKYERLIGGQYVDTILLERLNPAWFEGGLDEDEIEIELDFDAAKEEAEELEEDEYNEEVEAEEEYEDEEPEPVINPAKKPAIKKPSSKKVAVDQPVWDPLPKRRRNAPEYERLKTV